MGSEASKPAAEAGKQYSCAVLGAAGGIGQPLALLLAASPHVRKLSLCEWRGAPRARQGENAAGL
jgi:hypothetical protein